MDCISKPKSGKCEDCYEWETGQCVGKLSEDEIEAYLIQQGACE